MFSFRPVSVRFHAASVVGVVAFSAMLAGCATERRAPAPAFDGTPAASRVSLPAAIGARWTPPEFATRSVDGERAAVLAACVDAAKALGYSVSRLDAASGRIIAERRQTNAFDGARQDTLTVTLSTVETGSVRVSTVLRETVESGARDERSAGGVAAALVRDRAPYDSFFNRVRESLARSAPSASSPASP